MQKAHLGKAKPDKRSGLTKEQEAALVQYVVVHHFVGQCLTTDDIIYKVNQIIQHVPCWCKTTLAKKWRDGTGPSRKWARLFLKRHKYVLRPRVVDHLDPQRARVPESSVKDFFDQLKKIFTEFPNLPPGNICNLDETSLQPLPKKKKVWTPKGARRSHAKGNECRFSLTCLMTIFADGTNMPPFFIVKGKKYSPPWFHDTVVVAALRFDGHLQAGLTVQGNAWMDTPTFLKWIEELFLPHTTSRRSAETPLLLLMDNFGAHINHEVIGKLVDNHVKVVTLPPHSSQLLQALDVGIMLPFKKHMDNALAAYMNMEGGGDIKEKDLIICLFKYYECHGKSVAGRPYNCFSKALRSHNIMSAFQDVGIWPLDYNKVKGLAYRQDTSSSPSSSLHSKSSGSNVASNDPEARRSQIEAPSRAAALAHAEDILANSTERSHAPPTQRAHMEEAARRYLMYTLL
jgi:hypothetical protein